MFSGLLTNVTEKQKNEAIEAIVRHATPRSDFYMMMILSVSMAAFAVILNSTVILIGSMLIAPLLYPFLSLALGIITADSKLMGRSLGTLATSMGVAILAGFVIGLLFAPKGGELAYAANVVVGAPSPLIYAIIAIIAGLAAAFAVTKPHLNETLPGVAISVTLVPPLATMGIGLSLFSWEVVNEALLLFLVNAVGIVFSAMIVFSLFRFAIKAGVAKQAVQQEETILEKERAGASVE